MIIDLTGELYTGMWNYGDPFPALTVKPLPKVDWVKTDVYCEIFDGLHSQSGTYLETPAHLLGDKSYPLISVGVEKLVDINTVILKLDGFDLSAPNSPITKDALTSLDAFSEIKEGDAVLVSCDWGKYWYEKDYLTNSPYFTKEAIKSLIDKKPFLLGSDFPRWENIKKPEGFFPDFYAADILMAAPLINLEKCPETNGKLTVLPIKAEKTSCAPCRAILKF